ncbi:carbon-nitrogen hydrolase [Mucisphaera calidilacus]|uniref:N-carbamoyl-D-amino acid hydrolase n=1 Tax=Mucisphaera calidilacus TaxID=2527982 RepID=A0A518C156_9BACT|nr:carbon-nitrogen hydrolase [Mucisphaera calidilacus]QDU72948.1 N-carbamoyl-D-amino acid hydrolase [Mucisphaera calidilacus]
MGSPDSITLGLVQHACPVDADPAHSLTRATDLIRDAAARGADLVVTQELFTGHYFPQTEDPHHFQLAQAIPGPTTRHLCGLAAELGIEISASLFERRAPGLFHNTSVMISHTGQITGTYRKMHIPDDPRFYEKYYFTPGDAPAPGTTNGPDAGFKNHPTRFADVGMLVCWDQWYPEAARVTALLGANVLLYPTAIGWHHEETDAEKQRQRDAWQTVQRAHAIANGVYVAAVNRTGTENELTFWGSSFIADPGGTIIAQAPADEEAVLVAECDLTRIQEARINWPFLRDRRVDAYGDLIKRMLDGT